MRVLFASTFGYGHVFPMVPLAQACAAAGHEVLWATSPEAGELIASAGLPAAPAGLGGADLAAALRPLHQAVAELPGPERAAFMFPRLFGATLAPPMATDLLALARSWGADLLVHEQGELASPLVGAVLGIPVVTHSFGGAVPAAFVSEAGEQLAELWQAHGLALPPYAGCFSQPFLDLCPPELQMVPTGHIARLQSLRPVIWTGPEPAALPSYLSDDGRPLVYLTLGTVQNHAPVLRAAVDSLAELPVRLLATVGPDGDPASLGPQPDHVTVERFVPQSLVLRHCDVVASHAGSGTFLGAVAHGVPQLCLPLAADQFRNAAAAMRCGAGLALLGTEATPEAIASGVTRLLEEQSFRLAAGQQEQVVAAMPAPREVVTVLEGLV